MRAPSAAMVFAAALEAPPEARDALIASQCAGDEALSARVRRFLAARDAAAGFLESPLPEAAAFTSERARREASGPAAPEGNPALQTTADRIPPCRDANTA